MSFGLVVAKAKLDGKSLTGEITPLFTHSETNPTLCNNSKNKNIPIEEWWEKEIILYWGNMSMTRKILAITAADKDGGAHLDNKLTEEYEALKSGSAVSIEVHLIDGSQFECSFENIHLSTLRQIGYEILNSKEILHLIENRL